MKNPYKIVQLTNTVSAIDFEKTINKEHEQEGLELIQVILGDGRDNYAIFKKKEDKCSISSGFDEALKLLEKVGEFAPVASDLQIKIAEHLEKWL